MQASLYADDLALCVRNWDAARLASTTQQALNVISDWVDDRVGPNYERQAFSKPTEYEKWGDKYYRKSK